MAPSTICLNGRLQGSSHPPCRLCVASALSVCSKSVPKCRKSGIESKERMSLRSKQIVKRKKAKRGGKESKLRLVGVPGYCSPGSRGVGSDKKRREGKGDNWTA